MKARHSTPFFLLVSALLFAVLKPLTAFSAEFYLTPQLGHQSEVDAVALSNDGRLAITAASNSVELWNLATGFELRPFIGHTDRITAVAFSSDDTLAVTGSVDSSVRIWDVATGTEKSEIDIFGGVTPKETISYSRMVVLARFLPGDTQVVTVSIDGTVAIWDCTTRLLSRQIGFLPSHPWRAALSHDGKKLAVGTVDGNIYLWNLSAQDEPTHYSVHGKVNALDFASDDSAILAGTDNEIEVLPAISAPPVFRFPLPVGVVTAKFAGGMSKAIVYDLNGSVSLWDLPSSQRLTQLVAGHDGPTVSRFSDANPLVLSKDGRSFLVGFSDGVSLYWQVQGPKLVRKLEGRRSFPQALAVSHKDNALIASLSDGSLSLWDLTNGSVARSFHLTDPAPQAERLSFSPDDRTILLSVGVEKGLAAWDVKSGKPQPVPSALDDVRDASFLDNGLIWAESLQNTRVFNPDTGNAKIITSLVGNASIAPARSGHVALYSTDAATELLSLDTGQQLFALPITALAYTSALSADGKIGMTQARGFPARAWDMESRHELPVLENSGGISPLNYYKFLFHATVSRDDKYLAGVATEDLNQSVARIWETSSGKVLANLTGHTGEIMAESFNGDGNLLFTGSRDGTLKIWSVPEGSEIASLISGSGDWLAVGEGGRFDSNTLETDPGLHCVFKDDLEQAWPLEIFMRDYYEPRLLPRLLACHAEEAENHDACANAFPTQPPIESLNRVQPKVKILNVHRGATADEAVVEVEALGKTDLTQPKGKTTTEAYDLRLFRDGQLVGQWPEPTGSIGGPEEKEPWRNISRVPTPRHPFTVKLPSGDLSKPVVFKAYAFNKDRVKSETTPPSPYALPPDTQKREAKAYVITIGINGYKNEGWDLEYAAKDAEDMSNALRHIKGYKVVPVTLVSEAPLSAGRANQATKDNIHAVLAALGRHHQDLAALAGVAHVEELARATPDDLVILSFSGHGYTEKNGAFYLLPSDANPEKSIPRTSLPSFISSEELSEWLREVDAGQMAMIIDACHSAASIEVKGFKPGPMGDRGLGQLAYDKGMRILAASQADDVALEIEDLHQGLLTYALVQEGLRRGKDGTFPADISGNKDVTLEDWLTYGEQRTPSLYEDIREHKIKIVAYTTSPDSTIKSRDSSPNPAFLNLLLQHAQTPSLFDFHKDSKAVILDADAQ